MERPAYCRFGSASKQEFMEDEGTAERLGGGGRQGMTGRVFGWLGIKDGVGLVETGVEGLGRSVDVMAIR
jgi:hypothetical protein